MREKEEEGGRGRKRKREEEGGREDKEGRR